MGYLNRHTKMRHSKNKISKKLLFFLTLVFIHLKTTVCVCVYSIIIIGAGHFLLGCCRDSRVNGSSSFSLFFSFSLLIPICPSPGGPASSIHITGPIILYYLLTIAPPRYAICPRPPVVLSHSFFFSSSFPSGDFFFYFKRKK